MADVEAEIEPLVRSRVVDLVNNNPEPEPQPPVEPATPPEKHFEVQPHTQSDTEPLLPSIEVEPVNNKSASPPDTQLETELPSQPTEVEIVANKSGCSTGRKNIRLPSIRDTVGPQLLLPRPDSDDRPTPTAVPRFYVPGQSRLYLDDLPIVIYEIEGVYYNMTQPLNETRSTHLRLTVDQREITYTLEVVQQPEKARACGSGPRSSADRRPVDPPPVVELRVFANGVDVTMSYDATFMLYASLENSRPIAGGKMHTPPTIPVLTGVAVASAAYLDRPKPAAYFIFPDLSIRHEGWYRLKFSLFEGVKHEADADQHRPFSHPLPTNSKFMPPVRHESMFNRLQVQSLPFQVFSAKKFPGLNKSTSLSKLVAEQGCRVRIRRDIRQRKRTQKADDDADDAHSSYQGTPQATYRVLDHSRSASRNSIGSQYEADAARRSSVESIYRQPVIKSRQPSIVGAPLGSPRLPNPSQMTSSMPPPPAAYSQISLTRPPPESSPLPSPFTPTHIPTPMAFPLTSPIRPEPPRLMFKPELENNGPTLPPLRHLPRPLYLLNDTQPTKRPASSRTYDAETALKDRERPDNRRIPDLLNRIYWSPEHSDDGYPDPVDQLIEPDTVEDEVEVEHSAMSGPMMYERADGSKQNKWRGIL